MLRKIFYSITAFSVFLSPAPVLSQEFIFRYKFPISVKQPAAPNDEFEAGNDIQVHFSSLANKEFRREIPVATKNVARWSQEEGSIPSGMSISDNFIGGTPDSPQKTDATYIGYDANGNRIARAKIFFTVFTPVGPTSEVNYYAHTSQYFFTTLPKGGATGIQKWLPVVEGSNPPGLSTKLTSLEGTAEKAGLYDVSWYAVDYLDRPVATVHGTVLVEDGPTFKMEIADQLVDKQRGETFNLTPAINHQIGTITYRLVPTTVRPEGISFDSLTGTISGVYDKFDTKAEFRIEARDSADGTVGYTNPFTLATKPDPNAANELAFQTETKIARKNTPFETAPLYPNTQTNNISYSAGNVDLFDLSFDGLKVSSKEGIDQPGKYALPITASKPDSLDFTRDQEIIILDDLKVDFPESDVTRWNEARLQPNIDQTTVAGVAKIVPLQNGLPDWMTITANRMILARPPTNLPLGRYGPYHVGIVDDITPTPARSGDLFVNIVERPRMLMSFQKQTVERYINNNWNMTPLATVTNAVGTLQSNVTVELIEGSIPPTMTIVGRYDGIYVYGTTSDPAGTVYRDLKIKVLDADGEPLSITSDPFNITVVEPSTPAAVEGNFNRSYSWSVNRPFKFELPTMANAYGKTTYSIEGNAQGLRIIEEVQDDQSKNFLVGTIGVEGSAVIKYSIADDIPDRTATGTITLNIQPSVSLSADPEYIGNRGNPLTIQTLRTHGVGPFTYKLSASSDQVPGLILTAAGALSGTPTVEGSFNIAVTITDATLDSATSEFNLAIEEPLPFSFAFNPQTIEIGKKAILSPQISNTLGNVAWTLKNKDDLPPGLQFETISGRPNVGKFQGTATQVGDYEVHLSAINSDTGIRFPETDFVTAKIRVTLPGTIKVDAIAKKLRASDTSDTYQVSASNIVGSPTFSFAEGAATYPDQLTLNAASGELQARFAEPGSFTTQIAVTDEHGRTGFASVAFDVKGKLTLDTPANVVFKQYEDRSIPVHAAANLIGDASYALAPTSAPLPDSFKINNTSGAIEAISPSKAQTIRGVVIRATDNYDGTMVDTLPFTVSVDARDPIKLQPLAIYGKQFNPIDATITIENGFKPVAISFDPPLPDELTYDAETQKVTGVFTNAHSSKHVITAVDSKGGTLGSANEPLTIEITPRDQLIFTPAGPFAFAQHSEIRPVSVGLVSNSLIDTPVWTVTPPLPEGLELKEGLISGKPVNSIELTDFVVTVSDNRGGALGQASETVQIEVTKRAKLGLEGPESFTFNQFAAGYFELQATNPLDGLKIRLISPQPVPDGITISDDGKVTGLFETRFNQLPFVFEVEDGVGDTASHTVKLSVDKRTPPLVQQSDVTLFFGHNVPTDELKADNILGNVSWQVVGSLPDGVYFNSSTNSFDGKPLGLGTWNSVSLTAYDTYRGETTNSAQKYISIRVIDDGTPIGISGPKKSDIRTGQQSTVPAPELTTIIGKPVWSVEGLTDTGLTFDQSTGIISGRPDVQGAIDVIWRVKDASDRTASHRMTINIFPAITLSFPQEQDIIYNYSMDKSGFTQPTATNLHSGAIWQLTGTNLPQGMTFNPTSGTFTGKPKEIGAFGPYTLKVSDDLPGAKEIKNVWLVVLMNDDPIELEVTDIISKIGLPFQTQLPTFDNTLGPHRFYSLDLAGTGLTVDPKSGVLSGSISAPTDRNFNLSITDDTLRVTSKPVRVQTIPRMLAVAPEMIVVSAQDEMRPVLIDLVNAYGAVRWEPINPSLLPEGMVFNEKLGRFEGTPNDLGVYGPFVLAATDSLGDRAVSDPVTIRSQAGAFYLNLANGVMPNAIKRLENYEYDFAKLLNPAPIGMDVSEVTWSIRADATNGEILPPGLTLNPATGRLTGTPTYSGEYAFTVTATGLGNKTSSKNFKLKIDKPDTKLEITGGPLQTVRQLESYNVDLGQTITAIKNINKTDVQWSLALKPADPTKDLPAEALPDGLELKNGVLSGKPLKRGTFTFTVQAKFDNTDEVLTSSGTFTIVVNDPAAYRVVFDTAVPHPTLKICTGIIEFRVFADQRNVTSLATITTSVNDPMYPASTLTDGIITGSAGWYVSDASEKWVMFSTPSDTGVTAIEFVNRQDRATACNPTSWHIEATNDLTNWTTITRASSNGTGHTVTTAVP